MSIVKTVALITGSTRGIGKAIALELARNNYKVIITGTNQQRLDEVVNLIESNGGEAFGIRCNLLENGASSTLIGDVIGQSGKLDVLVNNAGLAWANSFEKVTEEDYEAIMGLNVKAPMFLTKAALPHLLKSSERAIVNISSVVGHKAYALHSLLQL